MEEDLALGLSAGPGSGLVEEDLALGLSAGPGEPVLTLWKLGSLWLPRISNPLLHFYPFILFYSQHNDT